MEYPVACEGSFSAENKTEKPCCRDVADRYMPCDYALPQEKYPSYKKRSDTYLSDASSTVTQE